jgi:hypothetical protein
MKTQIFNNYSDFLNREDKDLNGVSKEFAENNPNWESENETNDACWNCSDCWNCSNCSYCSGKANNKEELIIPEIANIHQSVLGAVSKEGALNMGDWHTCDTTHCRAGWVVFLAGEAGKALEEKTNTPFAAMQIYKKSSPIKVSPTRFYDTNEVAMADIVRCANEEKQRQ